MKLIYSAIAIAALLAFGIGGCNMYKQNQELKLDNETKEIALNQAQLDKALLRDTVTAIKAEIKEVRAEDYGVADNVKTVTVYKTDTKVLSDLRRLQATYNTAVDSMAAQRDRIRIERDILEEYCVQLQEQRDSTSTATIDSLIEATVFPMQFTQEDAPWYAIDVFVENRDSARIEYFQADDYTITHREIKTRPFWWLRKKQFEVMVNPLNPYSVGGSATTYLIK